MSISIVGTPVTVARSSDGNSTFSVSKPTGMAAGDLMIVTHNTEWGAYADMTASDFILIPDASHDESGTQGGHVKVYYRVVTSSEPAGYVFGTDPSTDQTISIIVLRGASTTIVAASDTSTSDVAPSVVPNGPDDFLVCVATASQPNPGNVRTYTPPSGMTEQTDVSTIWCSQSVATKQLASSGATGSQSFSASGSVRAGHQAQATLSIAPAIVPEINGKILLEDGTGAFLLEDGTGSLVTENYIDLSVLAIHSSSPAVVKFNASTTGTTAAFTPPVGSLLVAIIAADEATPPCTGTVTDNKSGSWRMLVRNNTAAGTAEVWVCDAAASPANTTVSASFVNGWNALNTGLLDVFVMTGAAPAASQPLGSSANFNAASKSISKTPTVIGSYIMGGMEDSTHYGTSIALANTTILNFTDGLSTDSFALASWRSTSLTTALTATTYGINLTSGGGFSSTNSGRMVAAEIIPAATDTTTPVSTTESPVLSVSDVSTINASSTLTDSTALSTTEIVSLAKTSTSTDDVSLSITESSVVNIFDAKSLSDASALSISESSSLSIFKTIAVVDGGTLSASEAIVEDVVNAFDVADASTLSISDTASVAIFNAIVVSDAATISVADSRATYVTLSRTDTGALSVSDSLTTGVALVVTDAAAISIADSRSIFTTLSRSDAAVLSLVDVGTENKSRLLTDSASIGITETTGLYRIFSTSDNPTITLSESASITVVANPYKWFIIEGGTVTEIEPIGIVEDGVISLQFIGVV